ncbi:hypothetical protein [Bartonella raoultii]|uniref:Lipoprotein n=1 Tax=Bartonella raoultii TaxID=1457020 RepID=A0ABS7I756_9HYPH|nr:hypothetical protein [Bartonella raoultii]MBX4336287.1 hypothetical protein [Bartonella raoultii]
MKKILKLLSGISLFIMAGCETEQPPLTVVDVWKKPGADQVEVKKALLECGIQNFEGINTEKYHNINEKINADASIDACLIQDGFHHKLGSINWCEKYKDENLSICQSDAIIPQRSIKKRLSSAHCQKNKEQPECQP